MVSEIKHYNYRSRSFISHFLIISGRGELENPFEFDILGKYLLSMFCSGCIFVILTLLVEYEFCYKPKYVNPPFNNGSLFNVKQVSFVE